MARCHWPSRAITRAKARYKNTVIKSRLRETQNYVRSVLAYYHRYRQHRADPRLALSEARRLERASALPAEEPRDRMRDYSDVGSDP